MEYLRVKNWNNFQHYKQRNPPWIKLHNQLLADYDFSCLQDASKSHLILIWLLASQCDNKIPNDPAWIQRKIGCHQKPDIKQLIQLGFLECLHDACTMLATCISQTEERRGETETETHIGKSDCPVVEIISLYHATLPTLPKCKKITAARRASIRQRWREDITNLDDWKDYFTFIGRSPFLMGKTTPSNGKHKPFIASLDWIVKAENYAKIYEGKYHG